MSETKAKEKKKEAAPKSTGKKATCVSSKKETGAPKASAVPAKKAAPSAAGKTAKSISKNAGKSTGKSATKAPPPPAPILPKSQFGVTLSLPPANMELPVSRQNLALRTRLWAKDLEKEGHLLPDSQLIAPKEYYFSTGLGDFNKVATWAQWCGVRLVSDLANIDRQRFALVAVEQMTDVTTFFYGLLQRETGQIRHQFNLVVEQMAAQMKAVGITIPSWFDVKDLDHYRLG